jgi:DNA-binding HxlR family transcriptional regulator
VQASGSTDEVEVCCTRYQSAVELVGRRWTGAIISVLLSQPRRFSEISCAVPDLSDRLLAARLRELEECGIVERIPCTERASAYCYGVTDMGRDLSPALEEIRVWAERWLEVPPC